MAGRRAFHKPVETFPEYHPFEKASDPQDAVCRPPIGADAEMNEWPKVGNRNQAANGRKWVIRMSC